MHLQGNICWLSVLGLITYLVPVVGSNLASDTKRTFTFYLQKPNDVQNMNLSQKAIFEAKYFFVRIHVSFL